MRYVWATRGVTLALVGDEHSRAGGRKHAPGISQRAHDRQAVSCHALSAQRSQTQADGILAPVVDTACPCPHGVDIPTNFRLVNQARLFGLLELSRAGFKQLQTNKQGDTSALACKKCGPMSAQVSKQNSHHRPVGRDG